MAFQRRNWMAERIGWACMAVLVTAAALGVFSVGPFSGAAAGDPAGGLTVEYDRFQRRSAQATIKVKVSPQAVTADGFAIEIDEAFAETFRISGIRPQPARSTALADGMRFRFEATPNAPATIYLHVTPEGIGFAQVRLGLEGRGRLPLAIFTYP